MLCEENPNHDQSETKSGIPLRPHSAWCNAVHDVRSPMARFTPKMPVAILDQRLRFPDPRLADAEGLVAVGGDMSVARLLLAYKSGIFPWTVQPLTWWSPNPRGIFELDQFHVSRSLAKVIRKEI